MFDRAAWNRAWRRRNRDKTRAYDAARPERPRRKARGSRAAYFQAYRAANRRPDSTIRLRATKPNTAAVKAIRATRLEAAQRALASERAASMSLALAMPELAALVDSQSADAARYRIKYGPEFLDVGHARL